MAARIIAAASCLSSGLMDSREETHLLSRLGEFVAAGNAAGRQRAFKLLHSRKNILADHAPVGQKSLVICFIFRGASIIRIVNPIQVKHTSSARNEPGSCKEKMRPRLVHNSIPRTSDATTLLDGWLGRKNSALVTNTELMYFQPLARSSESTDRSLVTETVPPASQVVCDPGLHCRGNPQRGMDAAQVVIGKVQPHGCLQVLIFSRTHSDFRRAPSKQS